MQNRGGAPEEWRLVGVDDPDLADLLAQFDAGYPWLEILEILDVSNRGISARFRGDNRVPPMLKDVRLTTAAEQRIAKLIEDRIVQTDRENEIGTLLQTIGYMTGRQGLQSMSEVLRRRPELKTELRAGGVFDFFVGLERVLWYTQPETDRDVRGRRRALLAEARAIVEHSDEIDPDWMKTATSVFERFGG